MQYYRFPEKKIWKCLFVLFLFSQLALTRSGMAGTLLGFFPAQALMLGLIAAAGVLFLIRNIRDWKKLLTDPRMGAAGCFAFVLLLPMVLKQDWQLMYLTMLMGLLLAVFLSYFVRLQETARCYVLLLCVLAVYSILATYILRPLADQGILPVPRFRNSMGNDYYWFGLANVSITHVASRNFGIFREPGVYQFFLLIGLYLTNYEVSWKKPVSMWLASGILAVTLLTTKATGGVIALGLYIVVVFFEKKMYRNRVLLAAAVCLAVAAAAVVIVSFVQQNRIYWFLYDTLLEKFINRTDSVTERTAAISANIQYFLRNPLAGVPLAELLHAVTNNTVSTLVLFAGLGILGGLLHVAGWVALVWRRERKLWANLALLVILFMGFNTQNLTWDLYFWLFPTMALLERGLPLAVSRQKRQKTDR